MFELLSGGADLSPLVLIAMLFVGLLAGWIDAVVGGGGLVQLPALLLVPGMAPIQALATNKLGSIAGTTVAATTYLRRIKPDKSVTFPGAVFAFAGSVTGALVASLIPSDLFTPIILVVLVTVGAFTLLKPALGNEAQLRFASDARKHHVFSWLIGLCVGFYDGALGPGTGSFLVIGLVAIIGFSFLQASASAKVMNLATNLGALTFFIPAGHVVWAAGLALAVGNIAGGYLGAKTAVRKGSGFVRIIFIVVVGALVLKLGWDLLSRAV